jgi:hypothetical protein
VATPMAFKRIQDLQDKWVDEYNAFHKRRLSHC